MRMRYINDFTLQCHYARYTYLNFSPAKHSVNEKGKQWRIQDFSEEGVPTPQGGRAPTYDCAKFSQKLHEIERIWTPRGSLRSVTGKISGSVRITQW